MAWKWVNHGSASSRVAPFALSAEVGGAVSSNCFLDRMGDIRIDESFHGASNDRDYTKTRGHHARALAALHVEFTTVA